MMWTTFANLFRGETTNERRAFKRPQEFEIDSRPNKICKSQDQPILQEIEQHDRSDRSTQTDVLNWDGSSWTCPKCKDLEMNLTTVQLNLKSLTTSRNIFQNKLTRREVKERKYTTTTKERTRGSIDVKIASVPCASTQWLNELCKNYDEKAKKMQIEERNILQGTSSATELYLKLKEKWYESRHSLTPEESDQNANPKEMIDDGVIELLEVSEDTGDDSDDTEEDLVQDYEVSSEEETESDGNESSQTEEEKEIIEISDSFEDSSN